MIWGLEESEPSLKWKQILGFSKASHNVILDILYVTVYWA